MRITRGFPGFAVGSSGDGGAGPTEPIRAQVPKAQGHGIRPGLARVELVLNARAQTIERERRVTEEHQRKQVK
jgi:hypothetical protein